MDCDRVQSLTPRLGVRRVSLERRFSTLLHKMLVERGDADRPNQTIKAIALLNESLRRTQSAPGGK